MRNITFISYIKPKRILRLAQDDHVGVVFLSDDHVGKMLCLRWQNHKYIALRTIVSLILIFNKLILY